MKKWIIIGVIIAVVVVASVAGVGYVVLRQASSKPNVVESMKPLPGASDVSDASWSPDGLTILYASYPGIWTIDSDGKNQTYLGEGSCPTWSPDGSQIAFASDNGLEIMNTDGDGRLLLVDLAEIIPAQSQSRLDIDSLVWSPDGTMIAFVTNCSQQGESDGSGRDCYDFDGIWLVNADGSGLRQLITGSASGWGPVWSPDSQRIAFVSYGNDGTEDIWASHVDGSDLRQLTASNEFEFDVSWSPDGSKLAFASRGWPDEGSPGIWATDADGANKTQLMEGSGRPSHPSWSPDGSMLAFEYGGDIWIVNADGSGKTRLTKTSTSRASTWFTCGGTLIHYKEPQWSPDGTKLLFLNSLDKSYESWGETRTDSWGYDRLWVLELKLENGLG